jgi:hypothetical protein
MLTLFRGRNLIMRTMNMGKKARGVTIGERGKEALFVTPKPKPVVEFNGWVLREKVKLGFYVALAVIIGAVAIQFGWLGLLWMALIGFMIGFIKGGDIESAP